MMIYRSLLTLMLVFSFCLSAQATEISFYPDLAVGDIVQSDEGNILILSAFVYEQNIGNFQVDTSTPLVEFNNGTYKNAGSFFQNWSNPNGSGTYDVFVFNKFRLDGITVDGISQWTAIVQCYQASLTSEPVTKTPLDLTAFDTLFASLMPVESLPDSQKLNRLLVESQNIKTDISNLGNKVANMDPLTITQSVSFFLGALSGLAFVLSSNMRLA